MSNLQRLIEIMATLRDPDGGCPWDVEQTFESIAPYTIEEAYEVADAIERGDLDSLREELGDLLLQVVYHSRMAEEQGAFAFDDVAEAIANKLVRRHPHVFGDGEVASAEAQVKAWEGYKAKERAEAAAEASREVSALDDVPLALPALMRAAKLSRRMARVGFDWREPRGMLQKLEEELAELAVEVESEDRERISAELGDVLFVAANLARRMEVDPETALRDANARVEKRFRYIERMLAAQGKQVSDATEEELLSLWQDAKRQSVA